MSELDDELRAAREVIAALQRRLERSAAQLDIAANPAHKAIATLENTIDLRTRALAESEARYRALFDHSPGLAFAVDRQGGIMRANSGAQRMFGDARPLVGEPLSRLFVPPSSGRVEELLAVLVRGLEGACEASKLTMVGGRSVDVEVVRVPGIDQLHVLVRDMTARAALDHELQHSRRLAAIGRLAAGVAHEINNPLAVLRLGLSELREHDAGARVEQLDTLLEHVDRIARIVENLHTLASPRAPQRSRVELHELVHSARLLAAPLLGGVQVGVEIDPPTLAVQVDRLQIEQVLVNLLSNAARAMQGVGGIAIAGERVGTRVRVRVADEGPGIAPELLEHIFSPFVTSGRQGGMGLGLSIAWNLVEEHGGSLRASNRREGGACFELELPLGEAASAPLASTPAASDEPRGLRILCVDDEPVLRRSLVRLLVGLGHVAEGVESGEQALERLDALPFDLVISDLRMGGMDGETLRRTIAARFPALARRVLLISGFFRDEDEAGEFLQKPFTLLQLRAAIARIHAPASAGPETSSA
jgi:PAS domain S-box-containing protein